MLPEAPGKHIKSGRVPRDWGTKDALTCLIPLLLVLSVESRLQNSPERQAGILNTAFVTGNEMAIKRL